MKKITMIIAMLLITISLTACQPIEALETTQKIIDVLMQILPIIAGVIAGIIGDEAVRKIKNKKKE